MYPNRPQVAEGQYACGAFYGGTRCTGTYYVNRDEAEQCDKACRLDLKVAEVAKEREEERRLAREARRRKDEEIIKTYKEERARYERVFSGDRHYNFAIASHKVQAAAGRSYEQAERSLQIQLAWMRSRVAQLDRLIRELEEANREPTELSACGVQIIRNVI
ncbi:hypothetical protein BDW22DRAFT_1357072 [Trametopsis cervina]|nr:hypothetical protein BDW22DRAFT_1357072 [Trametopsis cervina]